MAHIIKDKQIDGIIAALIDIAGGDLSAQIQPSNDNNNLDAIAIGINMMVDNIAENNNKILALNRKLKAAKIQAEESNRLKSVFMATMSHELRTPLNHIIGFSSLIPDITDNEEVKEMSCIINEGGNNLLAIIEEIFELTILDQNEIILHKLSFELDELITNIKTILIEELGKTNKSEKISSKFEIDNSVQSLQLIGDQSKVIHLVKNLIRNAVKFTKKGEIILSFCMQNKDFICISIKDTGIGISPSNINNIFDNFRQADEDYTREYGGIGIGLSISSKLAELMGGKIEVKSELGVGSEFIFCFPINLNTII